LLAVSFEDFKLNMQSGFWNKEMDTKFLQGNWREYIF